jgi:undecaprenyl-diphosphatase
VRTLVSRPAVGRGLPDAALVLVGLVLLGLTALPVDRRAVPDPEAAMFGVLNGSGVLPFVLIWPVMQLGNVLVVPASALLAAALRRWWLALELLVAGLGTYVLAKVVKGVVTALLVVAWPALGRRGRIAAAALVGAVCLARVHVGAHLPLDVVGGAALGLAVAGGVRLVLGRVTG